MRAALLILAVVLGGCQREPDFSERYDAASKKIGTAARQIDVALDKRAKETGPQNGSAASEETGSPPRDGPEPPR
jgi:hypothetical protein